jgi:hypothetical protein
MEEIEQPVMAARRESEGAHDAGDAQQVAARTDSG